MNVALRTVRDWLHAAAGLPPMLRRAVACLLVGLAITSRVLAGSPGDPITAASPEVVRADEGLRSPHAWVVLPAANSKTATLLHMPPRDGTSRTGPGTLRRVTELGTVPATLAAVGERVYTIGRREFIVNEGGTRSSFRRVVSYRAVPIVTGSWEYQPSSQGHTETALSGEGELVDVVGASETILALLAPIAGDDRAKSWRTLALQDDGWSEIPLPTSLSGTNIAWARMIPGPDARLMVQPLRSDSVLIYRLVAKPVVATTSSRAASADSPSLPSDPGDADRSAPSPTNSSNPTKMERREAGPQPTSAFEWSARPTDSLETPPARLQELVMQMVQGQIIAVRGDHQAVQAWVLGRSGPTPLVDEHIAAAHRGVMLLTGASRIIALDVADPPAPSVGDASTTESTARAPANREIVVREWSASTGMSLFTGPVRRDGPLSLRDFNMLAIGLSLVTGAALLFVMRAENTHVVHMPPGVSLASPMRRLIAVCVDAAAAYLIAQNFSGISGARLASMSGQEALGNWVTLIGVTILAAAVHCTIGEWLTGRSLGKMVAGCAVVPAAPLTGSTAQDALIHARTRAMTTNDSGETIDLPRISLRQAIVRNVVRWVPPLALLMLLDPNLRHPGDVIAKTVVVVPDPPHEDEDQPADDGLDD